MADTLTVTLDIEGTGEVSDVRFSESQVRSVPFDACVTKVYKNLQFTRSEGGTITVNQRLFFSALGADKLDI